MTSRPGSSSGQQVPPPDALPFSSSYAASDDLVPVIAGFLANSDPGVITWSDLDDVPSQLEQTKGELEVMPFRVWVSSVGASH